MGNTSPLLVFIVCAFSIHTSLEASFCDDVKYITIDDPRRSTAHKTSSSIFWLCDRAIIQDDVWYRFSSAAGEEMPTTEPVPGSCSAGSPLWMNGSHPTVHEGTVSRNVCANVPHQHPFGCADHYDIKVRNCSGYYIYQLKTPKQCYSVYCAGSKLPNCTVADPEDYCLENRPPYISMPHRYYALEDSEFELLFNATDPEGYPMRYSYLFNATVSDVSVDQKLVSISVKKSGNVSLKVEDYPYGGYEDIHTIEIVTIPCKCQNRGKCYNKKNVSTSYDDFSNVKCACIGPYTGELCQVSPCDNLPCFPDVDCSVRSDSYECGKCPAKFEGNGKKCQLVLTGGDVVVEAEFKIVSGLEWNDSLLDKTSFLYKSQTAKIVAQIKQAFSGSEQFLAVVVNRYRKGSVVVEFQVVLKEMTNDPLKPLRTYAKQNKFGNFIVDRNSIKEENSTEVEGTLNVLSGLEWNDDLLDRSSSHFQTESYKVAREISNIYENEKDFVYVFVTGFRKKDLMVEFKIVWRNKGNKNKVLEKLRSETKDGQLGNLKIKKDSVKEKKTVNSSNGSSDIAGIDKVVFIVVVCIVSILALVSIVVCGVCIRKKHVSIIMLTTQDDHHQFAPRNESRATNKSEDFQMKKRPAHNQVVDIQSTGKMPYI